MCYKNQITPLKNLIQTGNDIHCVIQYARLKITITKGYQIWFQRCFACMLAFRWVLASIVIMIYAIFNSLSIESFNAGFGTTICPEF